MTDESNSSGLSFGRQVYIAGMRVWSEPVSGTGVFLFQDHLGSVRVTGTSSGTLDDDIDNLPFGYQYANYGTASANHYRFTDDESDDAQSSTEYAVFRNLDPWMGRFNRPDPYGGSTDFQNPQSLNRYPYVMNQPSIFFDPFGLMTLPPPGPPIGIWYPTPPPPNCPQVGTGGGIHPMAGCGGGGGGGGGGGAGSGKNLPCLAGSGPLQAGQSRCAPNNTQSDPYPKRLFGTHWCGPGGAGPTVNQLDAACKAHDECYDRLGYSPWSNLSLIQDPGLQACNQALCDAAAKSSDLGATRVRLYFSIIPKDYCR